MNIVIPMAGRGERFRHAGFQTAKPLIPLHGAPLYVHASLCLPLELATALTYVVLAPEWPGHDIAAELGRYRPTLPPIEVLALAEPTRGQSETVLFALANADPEQPLLIYNCDSYFDGEIDWRQLTADAEIDGALVCFKNTDPRYSFARNGNHGWVDLVTEKVPVSDHACTGAYYFRRTKDFIDVCRARLSEGRREQGEYYVAPLYNDLISRGAGIKTLLCRRFICFGTPEELQSTMDNAEACSVLGAALAGSEVLA